ncbi:MAG TPA: extracellular solute-binding protein [Candidatus Acidoferrales bacterium]|nr:extracellular solute-binding protein [Candidatus Acidoferrales bacterium]
MHSRPAHHRSARLAAILVSAAFVAAACSSGTTTPPTTSNVPGTPTASEPTATFGLPTFSPAALRWYCCLGTGEDPTQQPTENQVSADFATNFPGSSLKFEVVTYDAARDALSTQIRGGNGPDIVGPTGIGGFAAFQGQWLDLAPYIANSHYDLSQFDPAAVDFYKSASEGEIGIPFDVYPSMVWYKKDMFSEAGLKEPPHTYGTQYQMPDGSMVDWSYDTLKTIALKLTVDKNGKAADEAGFDPNSIVQYGFEPQRDDLRGLGAYWGAGNLTGPDGKTVVIPEAWKAAWKFFYDGMWTSHFIMNGKVYASQEFNGGGYAFFSGKVAMSENFLWTTYGVADAGTDWDLAAIPSYNGTVTSPLNADSFGILKGTKNPDAAFAALTYLLGDASDKLLQAYGGMPARPEKQDAFFETLGKSDGFPTQVDWQVAKDSVKYADNPNFEAPMPKYNETLDILSKYLSRWTTIGGLNMDTEFTNLQNEIQAQWNS